MGLIFRISIVATLAAVLHCAPFDEHSSSSPSSRYGSSSTPSSVRPLPAVIGKDEQKRPYGSSLSDDQQRTRGSLGSSYNPQGSQLGSSSQTGQLRPASSYSQSRPVRDTSGESSEENSSEEKGSTAARVSSVGSSSTSTSTSTSTTTDDPVNRQRRDTQSTTQRAVPLPASIDPPHGLSNAPLYTGNRPVREAGNTQGQGSSSSPSTTHRAVPLPAVVSPGSGLPPATPLENSRTRQTRGTIPHPTPIDSTKEDDDTKNEQTRPQPQINTQQRPSSSSSDSSSSGNTHTRLIRDTQSTTVRAVPLPASVAPPEGVASRTLKVRRQRRGTVPHPTPIESTKDDDNTKGEQTRPQPQISSSSDSSNSGNTHTRLTRDTQSTTHRAVTLPASISPPEGVSFKPLEVVRQRRDATSSTARPRLTKDIPKDQVLRQGSQH